jgi:hypothetical protein
MSNASLPRKNIDSSALPNVLRTMTAHPILLTYPPLKVGIKSTYPGCPG